jgi:hypothetical protein
MAQPKCLIHAARNGVVDYSNEREVKVADMLCKCPEGLKMRYKLTQTDVLVLSDYLEVCREIIRNHLSAIKSIKMGQYAFAKLYYNIKTKPRLFVDFIGNQSVQMGICAVCESQLKELGESVFCHNQSKMFLPSQLDIYNCLICESRENTKTLCCPSLKQPMKLSDVSKNAHVKQFREDLENYRELEVHRLPFPLERT